MSGTMTPSMSDGIVGIKQIAAEAGISAALSQFRSALGAPDPISGAVYGDPRLLPCTVTGTAKSRAMRSIRRNC